MSAEIISFEINVERTRVGMEERETYEDLIILHNHLILYFN